jgi:hypothetical protein
VLLLQFADWVANFRDHNWRLFVITYNAQNNRLGQWMPAQGFLRTNII